MTSHPHHRSNRRETGAGFVEYALLLALMAFVLITVVDALGKDTSKSLDDTADKVASTSN